MIRREGLLLLILYFFLPKNVLTSVAIGIDSVSHFFEGAAIVLGTSRKLGSRSRIATDHCVP